MDSLSSHSTWKFSGQVRSRDTKRSSDTQAGQNFQHFFPSKWNNEISGNQGLLNRELCTSFLKWSVGLYVMYFTLLTHPTPETILIVEIIQMRWFSQGRAVIRITCNYYWGSGTDQVTGQGDWGGSVTQAWSIHIFSQDTSNMGRDPDISFPFSSWRCKDMNFKFLKPPWSGRMMLTEDRKRSLRGLPQYPSNTTPACPKEELYFCVLSRHTQSCLPHASWETIHTLSSAAHIFRYLKLFNGSFFQVKRYQIVPTSNWISNLEIVRLAI